MTTETQIKEKKIEFWTVNEGIERLSHTSIEDAIEEWADEWDLNKPIPEEVEVYGFSRSELPDEKWIADAVLDNIWEALDEEYSDYEGYYQAERTDAVKQAALAFARVVRSEYVPWTCNRVDVRTVKVSDHIELLCTDLKTYYPARCTDCGFEGCSSEWHSLPLGMTGDYSTTCPVCYSENFIEIPNKVKAIQVFELIDPSGKVSYRRPWPHKDIEEAVNTLGYTVRKQGFTPSSVKESYPRRIQRKRTKGWRMPKGAIYVGRPTKWGNPYPLSGKLTDRSMRLTAVEMYKSWIEEQFESNPEMDISELHGRDLACWCNPDQPCHADVLLELANGVPV